MKVPDDRRQDRCTPLPTSPASTKNNEGVMNANGHRSLAHTLAGRPTYRISRGPPGAENLHSKKKSLAPKPQGQFLNNLCLQVKLRAVVYADCPQKLKNKL